MAQLVHMRRRRDTLRAAIVLALFFVAGTKTFGQTPTLVWRYPTGGQIRGAPAIGPDGSVYAASDDQYLYALAPDGTAKWRAPLGGLPDGSLSVGPDGTVYCGLRSGVVVAVNPSGGVLWNVNAGSELAGDPAVATDGTIFVASTAGTILAVSLHGEVEWSIMLPAKVTLAPALDGSGTVYVGGADRRLYAISRWGRFRWSLPIDSAPRAIALGLDGDAVVLSDGGTLYRVDPAGDIVWSISSASSDASFCPLVEGGTILLLSPQGDLTGYASDGKVALRASFGARITPEFTASAGGVYDLDAAGTLRWLPVRAGASPSTVKIGTSGTIELGRGGHLYVGGRDWLVYGYAGGRDAEAGGWSEGSGTATHARRSSAGSAGPPPVPADVPDYISLTAGLDVTNRASVAALESETAKRVVGGAVGKSTWYVERILISVLESGVTAPAISGNSVVNDFPDLRMTAAEQLAQIGSLSARNALVSVLDDEKDAVTAAAEIAALGRISSDPDGASTRAIVRAMNRFQGMQSGARVTYAGMAAIARIAAYRGAFTDPSGSQALLDLSYDGATAALRHDALETLQGLSRGR